MLKNASVNIKIESGNPLSKKAKQQSPKYRKVTATVEIKSD